VLASEPTEARPGQRLPEIAGADVAPAVALACQGKNGGIRADLDRAVDASSEMDP
jgi:hypothetical protein